MTAEIFLAGSILIDSKAIGLVCGQVEEDDFSDPLCAAVFRAAAVLKASGLVIDPLTIRESARQNGVDLPTEWLKQVMEITPTAANAPVYAAQTREAARLRRVKSLAASVAENSTDTADELLAGLQTGIERIRKDSGLRNLQAPEDRVKALFDRVVQSGKDQFVPSGFETLDRILGGGFLNGGLYIVGARPAVGKTTFAINIADKICGNVLFCSLEMSSEAITAKQFSRRIGIPASQILSGIGEDDLWQKLAAASGDLVQSGVYINSRFDMTPGQIQLLAQEVPDIKAVIIDYLGLILPTDRCSSTYERISSVSRELKRIALSLNVPVVCLAQLSRGVENREDKRPRLSDLRDSGAIEQDADAVMFLYRDDYYNSENTDGGPSVVELSIAKNRHGACGKVDLLAKLEYSFFKERNVS